MKIGFIGLGKMGGNMVERLLRGGHEAAVYDHSADKVREAAAKGAQPAATLAELVGRLPERKIIWFMVPAGEAVDRSLTELLPLLRSGDIVVDGGNSFWRDSQRRAEEARQRHGVHFVDCGTSGGVWGLQNGYCLMYGGDADACRVLEPVFKTLAPENGCLYCGGSGAGHFVKMTHNGIEYGMMQAYAEGFELMEKSCFNIDLRAVAEVWQRGSVVRSWLLELAARALAGDPRLATVKDYVEDSGEGRWAIQSAIDFGVPAPVTALSLFARFRSRQPESFAMKMLAALRQQFGGHATRGKE